MRCLTAPESARRSRVQRRRIRRSRSRPARVRAQLVPGGPSCGPAQPAASVQGDSADIGNVGQMMRAAGAATADWVQKAGGPFCGVTSFVAAPARSGFGGRDSPDLAKQAEGVPVNPFFDELAIDNLAQQLPFDIDRL